MIAVRLHPLDPRASRHLVEGLKLGREIYPATGWHRFDKAIQDIAVY